MRQDGHWFRTLLCLFQLCLFLKTSEAQDWKKRIDELVSRNSEEIVLTAVGDLIFNREISGFQEPEYQNLYRVMQEADIGFGNLEMSLNEQAGKQRGVYNFRRGEEFGWEILKLGINWVGLANNHSLDYGAEGLRDCLRILRQRGIAFAGAGENLAAARRASFKQVGRTRFALLSFMSGADWTHGDPDQPGVNTLSAPRVFLDNDLGIDERGVPAPLAADVRAMEDAIALAKRNADIVLVAYHLHWVSHSRAYPTPHQVPPHQQLVLHRAIEAGADVILGSGPHVLRGIEIYQGKPIFYSLGDFIYQYRTAEVPEIHWQRDQQQDIPEEFETVLARLTIREKQIRSIQLLPVAMPMNGPRTGSPSLADEARGKQILDSLDQLSQVFGTRLERKDWYGQISLNPKR